MANDKSNKPNSNSWVERLLLPIVIAVLAGAIILWLEYPTNIFRDPRNTEVPAFTTVGPTFALTPTGVPLLTRSPVATKTSPTSPIPEATATALAQGVTLTVNADYGWQNTGISVTPGQFITIEYLSGRWSTNGKEPYVDADGHWWDDQYGCKFMALIARIGSDSSVLCVGNFLSIKAQSTGILLLRPNDGMLSDNAGQITVKVAVK